MRSSALLPAMLVLAASPALAQNYPAAPLPAARPAASAAPVGWKPSPREGAPDAIAEAALANSPIWDGHNDVPIQLRERFGNMLAGFDFTSTLATGASNPDGRVMQTDLTRLRQGRVGAQFWSVYVPAELPEPGAVQATLEQIDVAKRLIARNSGQMAYALTADDVSAAMNNGRIASLLGMEGGHSIGSSLAVLRQMYAAGARYMTLTHTKSTSWADSANGNGEHRGLTDFGENVVREMNRLGMLVDLSHVSEETMMDALDVARAPVIFSHSGVRALDGHVRNVPDAVLDRLPANGGIVMMIALPAFVSEARRQWGARMAGEEARLKMLYNQDPQAVKAGLGEWKHANPEPETSVGEVADHIEHIARRIGIAHIGIGGDYDGMPDGPVNMKDVSGYPALFRELARRGFSQSDLEMIASGNMLRVMRAAEAYAAAHSSDPPIETKAASLADND